MSTHRVDNPPGAGMGAHAHAVSRLSQLYAALSQVNQAIVRLPTRHELLQKICRVLVEQGGYNMAWIGWYEPSSQRIVPVADWGDASDYIRRIKIYGDDRPEGRGPTGLAFRTEQPYICNDLLRNPVSLPWREELSKRNHRASAVFPIREKDNVAGTLTVLADRENFFNDKEIALLEEAAANISFGLDNLLREQERVDAAERAKNEKQFSDIMIESMPGIVYFYDMHGKFMRWNKNFEVASGYGAEEIAVMHPLDFFSEREKQAVEAKIGEVFANGESSIEVPFLTKGGQSIPYFFTGRKVIFKDMECLVGVGIDITQRKLAESKVAESEQKYRELVEHANSIILRWNARGEVTFINKFGQHYFGYGADEIVGKHVLDTIVPTADSDGHDLERLMADILANPAAFEQNINQNIKRNGERVWISWTNRIVHDAQGGIAEILSIGSDITERLRAEETIRELNLNLERRVEERTQALNAALVRAEAADRIKSAFLATMSHELRTPLNSIIGFTGIILQGLAGPLNQEQTTQLGMVKNSARHLLTLINDVLDISKIEAGQLEVKAEPFDLRASIERVMGLVKPLADKKGLALTQELAGDIGTMISDCRRLEQILINLLNNAIKFTTRGGVTLAVEILNDRRPHGDDFRARSDELRCQTGAAQAAIRFRIKDTGIGIKPEDIASLFRPFHQIDTGLSRQHEGSGLGLVICQRLVVLMGGEISVQSEWQKGSEFSVILPLRPVLKNHE